MIAIDLVVQARNGLQLVIKLQDFLQIADSSGVNLNFDHVFWDG